MILHFIAAIGAFITRLLKGRETDLRKEIYESGRSNFVVGLIVILFLLSILVVMIEIAG